MGQGLVSLEKTEAPERQGGPLAAQNVQSVTRGYRNVCTQEKTEAPERQGGPLAAQNAQDVKRSYRNLSFP